MLREAREAGAQAEHHRAAMQAAADRRTAAVRALREKGWSVRRIAAELDVSKAVVQGILSK